jgi:uncharacterized protein (TIGR03435 family)
MTGSFVVSILTAVTMVMAAALGATSVSRRRRAATRHALLVAAFTIALVLPVASALAPYLTIRVSVPAPRVVADAVAVFDDVQPMPATFEPSVADRTPAASRAASVSLTTVLETIWLVGFAACLAPVMIGLFQVRSLRGLGLPWQRGRALADALAGSLGLRRPVGIVLHESVSGPMTFGTWRPTIVMPIDAEAWTDEELTRAIVHELEHISRADWLTQCAARTLCAAYWFHPLVWIARRQLVLEAERASDDAVLRYAEAAAYADQLVDLARRLSAGHQPVLAMANRRDLAARVHALLDGQQSRGRAGAWLIAALACAAAALVMALSPMRVVARSPLSQATDVNARFDVVSVRPCDPKAPPQGAGRGGSSALASPGHFRVDCSNVIDLIVRAYVVVADGRFTAPSARPSFDQWHAGPDWLRSERFTIEAATNDATPLSVMQGPMLQAVLEDRFKLDTHYETRDVPVLELVVAKGGAKLTPFVPGTCVPYDYSTYPGPPLEAGQHRCLAGTERGRDGKWVETVEGLTLDDWVTTFDGNALVHGEPPIVNRTGLTGPQTFRYEYSGRSEDRAAELKSQLGLDLRPGRAPREFLVLDHIERPVLDDVADAPAPAISGAQTTASSDAAPQAFDVASVRPCETKAAPTGARGQSAGRTSPGYVNFSCVTLRTLINAAYADDLLNKPPATTADGPQIIRGGPSWAYADTFTIEARAEGVAAQAMLTGPMLRAFLEDRFQLKTHRATEQQSMYALTVAKSGLEITPTAPGGCWEFHPGEPVPAHDKDVPACGTIAGDGWGSYKGYGVQFGGSVSPRFADWLFSRTHRMVVDRTGLNGRYDFALEFTPDEDTPGARGRCGGDPRCVAGIAAYGLSDERPATFRSGATIFKALETLGLHLEPITAPAEYIVIDHAERPSSDRQ